MRTFKHNTTRFILNGTGTVTDTVDHVLTEDGDQIITEGGDDIVTEDAS